jgi:uncharacterized membrane protein YdjX (TVP38/TMEM64 family)
MTPLAVIPVVAAITLAMGWHQALSAETLIRHRAAIEELVASHRLVALAAFVGLYVAVVTLSLPGAAILTIAGGFIFGTVEGALAAIVGATSGATLIFLAARSAVGEWLLARAGSTAGRLATSFREDAFSYLLFLRFVPLFPFWLVNIVPALCGIRLAPYLAATAIGIVPATVAFALFGAGLDSALAAQQSAYRACVASGQAACRLDFDLMAAATPRLIAALVLLAVIALVPIVVRRWRAAPPG